jgi:hypothetical protein
MACFVVETRLESIPEPVVIAAKTAILDTVGVTLAAIAEPVAQIITQYVRDMGAAAQATVLGSDLQTSAPWASCPGPSNLLPFTPFKILATWLKSFPCSAEQREMHIGEASAGEPVTRV